VLFRFTMSATTQPQRNSRAALCSWFAHRAANGSS